jgi:iron complex outermembrane receptor protein
MAIVMTGFAVNYSDAQETSNPIASAEHHYQLAISKSHLTQALVAFSEQTHIQFARFSDVDPTHLIVGPLSGSYTAEEALELLLRGTGLTYRFINARTVAIVRQPSAAPPSTRANAAGSDSTALSAASDARRTNTDTNSPPHHGALLRFLGLFFVCAAAGLHSNPACSQNADQPAGASGASESLEEIVVTATRRSEEISKVPISIVALNQSALENSGIKTVQELAGYVPGVEFDTASGFGPNTLTNIAIRGVNSNIGTSTTGIYLDDVPIQTRIVALSYWGNPFPLLFDVDHVEVDRGPQGTLFGAGAEGGAIRMISPNPGFDAYSGFAHSELATTDHGALNYEEGAAFGGPIVPDTIGFRVSAWARRDGGYVDRVDPLTGATAEANANSTNSYVLHGALGIRPTDGLTITPSLFTQDVHNNDSDAYFEYLSDPGAMEFKNGRLLQQPASDRFYMPSVKVEAILGAATVTSISAYFHRSGIFTQDATSYNGAIFGSYLGYGNPMGPEYPESYADAGPVYLSTSVNLLTQEIRATSNDANARLRWTVGAFFSSSSQTDRETVISPFYATGLFGIPASAPLFYSSITSRDSQIAGFAQVDYRIVPSLTLTVGGRVSHNVAKYVQFQSGPLSSSEFPYSAGQESETPFIPKAELSYQATDASLIYVSAAKGYRVGGANQPIPLAPTPSGCPLPGQPPPFSGDSLWSYEIGSKNRLLGGRLQLDASVFFVDWSKIQQQIYFTTCTFGFIANTGDATSKGFDLAARIPVGDHLTLGFMAAYTDARVKNTVAFDGATLVKADDVIGTPPGVGSPWNLTGSSQYDFKLSGYSGFARIEDIFHSHNTGPFNSQIPGTVLYAPDIPSNPAYNQLNARLGGTFGSIEISLFTNNLLNAHPALYRYQDSVFSNLFTNTTLRPRTTGVTANYKF